MLRAEVSSRASTNFRTNFPVRCLVLDCAEVAPSSFWTYILSGKCELCSRGPGAVARVCACVCPHACRYVCCVYTRICVSRRRPAFFPTLYTRHYLTSLSRACSRSPPYERDSALRSVVLRAYGIRVLLRMRVPPSPPRTGTRVYGLPPCVARRRRRPLVASFR